MRDQITWLALVLLALPVAARAAGVSGSYPMLCAVTEARDCSHGGDCVEAAPEELNLPPFVVIDTKAKLLSVGTGGPDGAFVVSGVCTDL